MHMHVEYRMHFGLQLQRYRSKKKVQRLSKAQKDLLPTKRLMEKDSSASGKKKRLEECDGESERGELLAAVCDTGIQLNDILKAQKQRKKCNV